MAEKVRLAIRLCEGCVQRVHFVNGRQEGALISEFLTSKGSGTMIYQNDRPYKMVHGAMSQDTADIANMIRTTVDSSIVEEVILRRIADCRVLVVDGHVHASAVLSHKEGTVRVEYMANSTEYDASEVLFMLLDHIINEAREVDAERVVVDHERAPILIGIWPWFLGLGFEPGKDHGRKVWIKAF